MNLPAPNQNPGEPPENDLEWLAFRYISDELSPQDRMDFEHRLETDLEAQQAVVEAVGLTRDLAVAMTASSTAPRPTPATSNGWLAWALSVAALLLAGLSVGWYWQQNGTPTDQVADADSIAVAWVETLDEEFEEELESVAELAYDTDVVNTEQVDWMLAALSDMDVAESGEEYEIQ